MSPFLASMWSRAGAGVFDLDTGVLYCDDNLDRLTALPSESVDLIYLDPPFFSNRVYEVIWGDEAEVRSFEDRWEGGIQHYIGWMRDRVVEMRRTLKPTGSLYLHCDPHASHYLKVMLDEVFLGQGRFLNEVAWKRTAAKGDARRKFGAIHDVLLVYVKGADHTFNPQHIEQDDAYLARFNLDDHDDRGPYRLAPLDSPSERPNLTYEYKGYQPPVKGWRVSREIMEQLDAEGRLAFPRKRGGRIARKHYLSEQEGAKIGDVWTDITPIQASSAQKQGYPTQKPESLLARVIGASSNIGDVVLDPFCGCGTTIAVADRMHREWVGIDISPTAMEIMRRRLWNQARIVPNIVNMPSDEAALRNLKPFEFQNWVVNTMNGTHSERLSRDGGIDGYSFMTRDPIQVKQSDKVGRVVVDQFETAMRKGRHDIGYVVGFSFTKDAYEEVARAKREDGLNIKLLKVKELLLLARRPEIPPKTVGPQPEGEVLPLPPMRKKADLPSPEELMESDKAAG